MPFPIYKLASLWQYGFVDSKPLTERRITYCTTYITKLDTDIIQLPDNKQYVFTSPGIGKEYINDPKNLSILHVKGRPNPFGYFNNRPIALPRYLRLKLFTDEEREQLTKSYFHFRSEDVIPEGPYFIANHVYDDYTAFLSDADKYRQQYNELYIKKYSNLWQQEMLTTPLNL